MQETGFDLVLNNERTHVNDPWTRTTVWQLTSGAEVGWAEEGKGGKVGTTVIAKQ